MAEEYPGQVEALRARLTTAEQERKQAQDEAWENWSSYKAAEARVEALTAMLHAEGYSDKDIDRDVRMRQGLPVPDPECNGNCIGTGSVETLVEDLACPVHGIAAQEKAESLFPDRVSWLASVNVARAALACPPQQRGE